MVSMTVQQPLTCSALQAFSIAYETSMRHYVAASADVMAKPSISEPSDIQDLRVCLQHQPTVRCLSLSCQASFLRNRLFCYSPRVCQEVLGHTMSFCSTLTSTLSVSWWYSSVSWWVSHPLL